MITKKDRFIQKLNKLSMKYVKIIKNTNFFNEFKLNEGKE